MTNSPPDNSPSYMGQKSDSVLWRESLQGHSLAHTSQFHNLSIAAKNEFPSKPCWQSKASTATQIWTEIPKGLWRLIQPRHKQAAKALRGEVFRSYMEAKRNKRTRRRIKNNTPEQLTIRREKKYHQAQLASEHDGCRWSTAFSHFRVGLLPFHKVVILFFESTLSGLMDPMLWSPSA